MKHFKKIHLGFLCLFVSLVALSAQQDPFFAFQPSINTTKATKIQQTKSPTTSTYFRHHKKLPLTYSGILLELTTSNLPLKRDHPLFKQFGNVFYDRLDEGGYAYCILTKFSDLDKAKIYLEQMILHRAPRAKVIKYQLGRRKKELQ